MFEVVVLGGGPAGYVAAIKAAEKGYKTACISPELGGTCLHRGCIPSKFLLTCSEYWQFLNTKAADFGINVIDSSFDLSKIMHKKDQIINQLASGIEFMFKKHKITWIKETGQACGDKAVKTASGQVIKAEKALILATGSKPIALGENTSDEALDWQEVPQHLCVVGAGYIGLELATVWSRLGAKVTVVDLSKQFLPFVDQDVSDYIKKSCSKSFEIKLGVTVDKHTGEIAKLTDGTEIKTDKVLYAVGRRPHLDDLKGFVALENNMVKIDNYMRTNVVGTYAIGDITPGPMLAHKGSEQAFVAVEHLYSVNPPAGRKIQNKRPIPTIENIPSVIYIKPEVAIVGATEQTLQSGSYKVYKKLLASNGRALTYGQTEGFVKILVDVKDRTILGACAVGVGAEPMICQVAVGMSFGATTDDFATICYPHPSIDETLKEVMFEASAWNE